MNIRKQPSRHNMNGRNRQPRNNNGGSQQNSNTQRMTFKQSIDKYTTLSKEASSLGDTITAEHYRQYAEHYRREYNGWLDGNQHLFEKQRAQQEQTQSSVETNTVDMESVEIDVSYLSVSPDSVTLQDNANVSYTSNVETESATVVVAKSPGRPRKIKPKEPTE